MIRVEPPEEPEDYDTEVRQKGRAWLEHPTRGEVNRTKDRPEKYWTRWEECSDELAAGFHYRCGFTASYTPVHAGNVDHFVSWAECKRSERHQLVYEWSNLRWLNQRVNQIKTKIDKSCGSARLLDPFEVEDDWFELDLGAGILKVTEHVPPEKLDRVRFTLEQLDLIEGRIVRDQREDALEDFRWGASLDRIETKHPLVARALRRLLATPDHTLSRENRVFKQELLEARNNARSGIDPPDDPSEPPDPAPTAPP